ncbi:hypothetical protein S40288_07442 [Stachybotrys chartarum IBT 40288]|nr:hypothetical protein S40288_07442 [Stachybotrys chartarum IBT 40288]
MIASRNLAMVNALLISAAGVTAQNFSYGADNFYKSDSVTLQPVTFPNQNGHIIAGNLLKSKFLNVSASTGAPAVVVSHPFGAVKEQSANLYATKLAEEGFITIAIDMPFYGGSSGEPRNGVNPDLYTEAFSAAVDYLATQADVDRERIGGLGICGSGSFVIGAAKVDSRIRAVATSSRYDMGGASRNGLRHSLSLEQRKALIDSASQQRWVETDGGDVAYGGGTPFQLTNASTAIDREFYDFYRTARGEYTAPGANPNYTTQSALTSNVKLLNFYPLNDLDVISPRPLLFISGDQAHSREFSENAYANAAEPKELYWVPGAGHVDLYDRVELIPFGKLTEFFRSSLV